VSPYHLAYVYTALGEAEWALDCLERAVAEQTGRVYGIKDSFCVYGLARPRTLPGAASADEAGVGAHG